MAKKRTVWELRGKAKGRDILASQFDREDDERDRLEEERQLSLDELSVDLESGLFCDDYEEDSRERLREDTWAALGEDLDFSQDDDFYDPTERYFAAQAKVDEREYLKGWKAHENGC